VVVQAEKPFTLHPLEVRDAVVAQERHHSVDRFGLVVDPVQQAVVAKELEEISRQTCSDPLRSVDRDWQDVPKTSASLSACF